MMGRMAEADPYELLLGRGTYEGEIDHGSFAFDEPTEAERHRRRRLGGG